LQEIVQLHPLGQATAAPVPSIEQVFVLGSQDVQAAGQTNASIGAASGVPRTQ
jgi:hypothetical protein